MSHGKGPPQELPVEGLTSGLPENNTRNKESGNTPPTEKSEQVVDSPSEYPPQDQPETPIDLGENLEKPSSKRSQKVPVADPFSRFWSGETADASDKDKKRHRWFTRRPKRRHSVELEILDGQDNKTFQICVEERKILTSQTKIS